MLRPMGEHYITAKDLLKLRGWTPATIERFLGEPDKSEVRHLPNTSFTISLFSAERVEQAESTSEWQEQSRGEAARKRRAERTASRANAMDRVRNFDVKVRNSELSRDFLVSAALAHYNDWKAQQRAKWGKSPHIPNTLANTPPEDVERITLNYIRHNLTNYDAAIKKLAVADGSPEEYTVLRGRFFDALRRHFPDFASALTAQEHRDSERDYEQYQRHLPGSQP
jgi:hypothetical protein